MLFIVLATLLGVAVLIGLAGALLAREKGGFIVTAALSLVGLLILTFFSAFTKVEARAVGIQTSFGQYVATVEAGAHLLSPWSEVEQFSTQIQPLDLSDLDDTKGNAVSVAFSGAEKGTSGGNGKVNAVVRWAIDTKSAENLWKKYKTFDAVRDNLVLSESQDAFREVIGAYPPNEARAGANIRPISDKVKAGLQARLADDGILIDSVSIKGIEVDENTAKSLEGTVIANNKEETAKSEYRRAVTDSQTAALREKSGALSPAANLRYCLDIVNQWDVKKNGPLPTTFNCALGGSSTPVIVGK
jgi:regulator of protease activity HflC (stomatin/prohibitin superfamily)